MKPITVVLLGCLLCPTLHALASDGEQSLLEEIKSDFKWLQNIRRNLHQIPELGFNETRTSTYIRSQLKELGIEFTYPVAQTGITADIGSGTPIFALRSDMDALPITEENDVEYKSRHHGRMHACGHDTHMTMLLGAAKLLKARESSLGGTVRLLFQPGEEGPGGAVDMIQEGALKGVAAVHGIHVWPIAPSGTITTKAKTIMAAQDGFEVTILGRGGHGAMPHLTADPVVAASMIVVGLQPLVSRETSPTDGAVVTVARFNTGEGASNVIPDSVRLTGTVRATTAERFPALRKRVEEVIKQTAALHGCSAANISWQRRPYPPVVNDAKMADLVADVAGRLAKFEWLDEPSMAAEDFSFMAQEVPGAFTFLGIRNESVGSVHGLHTPRFTMDEAQMPLGAALHAATAIRFLREHGSDRSGGRDEL